MKNLFTGKLIITDHARERMKERDVDAFYVKQQLRFIPHTTKEIQKWYIPGKTIFVTYCDVSPYKRIIITMGHSIPDWRVT